MQRCKGPIQPHTTLTPRCCQAAVESHDHGTPGPHAAADIETRGPRHEGLLALGLHTKLVYYQSLLPGLFSYNIELY